MNGPLGHAVLQVPVPPLEPFVRARTAHYDPAYLVTDPSFVHAHVTILGPVPEVLDDESAGAVRGVVGSVAPFDFVLARVATFPNGIIHLVPEPDRAFRELTDAMVATFPDHPPYAGEFDPVPHLTLDLASPGVDEATTAAALDLPVACRAERVELVWYEHGRCHRVRSWPLGVAAAP